mgnify:CR=1 FL=1
MSRYDKYDPKVGGFRAFLATDWIQDTDLNKVWPVGLDVNGLVVKGAGQSGIVGVLVITRKMYAADEPVDVMTAGEIVEFNPGGTPAPAGSAIFGEGSGDFEVDIAANVAAGAVRIGHTVEASATRGTRLVVRVAPPALTGGSGA